MSIVRTRHTETSMNYPIAASRTPATEGIALPGGRLAHKIRFVAGVVISSFGAAVLLADAVRFIALVD